MVCDMKTAVIYYSMSLNTFYVASIIAKELKADLICLEPEEAYPDSGVKKYFWGGRSALMKDKPALKPYSFEADKYDVIILGTPVWASCYTPPLRTFIEKYGQQLKKKRLGAFACYSGIGASKALDKLKNDLAIKDFGATLTIVDPKDKKSTEKDNRILDFCHRIQSLS